MFRWFFIFLISILSAPAFSQQEKVPSAMRDGANHLRYQLTQGKGYAVCEAYLKHLNAFPPDEPPMVCERKIYPKFHDFTKPKWEPLDYWKHLDWLYQMDMAKLLTAPHQDKPSYESWKQGFEQDVKSGRRTPSLNKANLPFGKGKTRTYIAYEPGFNDANESVLCQKNSEIQRYSLTDGGLYRVFVLDEKGKNLAVVERRITVRNGNSFIEMMGAFEGCCGSSRARTDILMFKGELYFTSALFDGHDKKKNLDYFGILLGKPIFDNPLAVPRENDFPDSRYVEQRCNFKAYLDKNFNYR